MKTIAKRARAGARTPVVSPMKKLFWKMFVSITCLGIAEMVVDKVLKTWIEPIKVEIRNL